MKKLKSSELLKAYSELTKIAKSKGSKRKNLLAQKSNTFLDILCHCISNGINSIPKGGYKERHWKRLRAQRESLRFLSDYISCSHSKKKRLSKQRKKIVQQSGGSIGLILTTVLPLLADFIIGKIRGK